jgi:hypothetical protein
MPLEIENSENSDVLTISNNIANHVILTLYDDNNLYKNMLISKEQSELIIKHLKEQFSLNP